MTITRKELAKMISEGAHVSAETSRGFLDLVFEIMAETLERGEKIKIGGFGNFTVRQKRARRGRNPNTGEEMQLPPRRVVTFRPSPTLRKALKKGSP